MIISAELSQQRFPLARLLAWIPRRDARQRRLAVRFALQRDLGWGPAELQRARLIAGA